jgi:HprK-related kinase A
MASLASLGDDGIARRLAEGLTLATGPFKFRVRSTLPIVARNIAWLYAASPLVAEGAETLHDFHVRVVRVGGARRWWRPQVDFEVDELRPFRPLPADHAYALLEWGMNWCIAGQCHEHLALHAATLEREGCCVILSGAPGRGKSTLAAAMMLAGWRLLTDELTLYDATRHAVQPLARPLSLKNESIALIRARSPDAAFGDLARDTHKGSVSHLRVSARSAEAVDRPARPSHIVFPRWERGAATTLQRRPKAEAFMELADQAFNYSLLGRAGFDANARLIDSCACWSMCYGELDPALDALASLAS